jgi:hypothetical protein
MKNISNILPEDLWNKRKHEVFWDRTVEFDTWKKQFINGHLSYVIPTIDYLPIKDVIKLLGKKSFSENWPIIRLIAIKNWKKAPGRIAKWDTVWSYITTKSFDIKPLPEWKTLSVRRRDFLLYVAFNQGKSIYSIAKTLNMQYRRAHEHAKCLSKIGFINIRPIKHNNRTVHTLWVW